MSPSPLPPAPPPRQPPGRRRKDLRPARRFARRNPNPLTLFAALIEADRLGDEASVEDFLRKLAAMHWRVERIAD